MHDQILILDFGSQYTQLIARRIREANVYCEIHPFNQQLDFSQYKGVVLSGSPFSVHDKEAPSVDLKALEEIPVLAICFGAQLLAQNYGGIVLPSEIREYGRARLSSILDESPLSAGVEVESQVWMSHGDTISELPKDCELIFSTADVINAGYQFKDRSWFGIQFHPEVFHTTDGMQILRNFVHDICDCDSSWNPESFVETTVDHLIEELGDEHVILGLSGGVDSSVAAMLLHRAIGDRLHGIFVNNGLLRKGEFESVLHSYEGLGLNVRGVDASDQFYQALHGVSDPEEKRKIIGRVFIEVFDKEASTMPEVKWLAQGTIYPDVIESVSVKGPSATIKSHHNVGGLPDFMQLKVVEPLRSLFKDEVRKVGLSLGLYEELLGRHPFPGPGLAIRILGDITEEKVRLLQEVDHIFVRGLKEKGLYDEVWQAGAILLPVRSVGVMGDERTYEQAVALRAVTSTDGMTADWCHLPYDFLASVSNEIINKVKGVNRVVYDISSKPPATIEWE
ncbi:MAG: glutamine-hydrolyzing GMP synthase [Flavobacteriales bacterium]|nr:glutamine-hydrolyzing GMP synthase [Flavobacteriales bacterium]